MPTVICTAKITSPLPDRGFIRATRLGANQECGCRVLVADVPPSQAMLVRCPYGHQFYATAKDFVSTGRR
jgi:hypothetical protein